MASGALTAGFGEKDTLIGSVAADVFFLGISNQKYYATGGDTDYALIKNFQSRPSPISSSASIFRDFISLQGTPSDYKFETVNGSFHISTASGDLMGIVEGVPSRERSSSIPGIPGVAVGRTFSPSLFLEH